MTISAVFKTGRKIKELYACLILLAMSCSSGKGDLPNGVLLHDEMVQVMADVQVAEAAIMFKSSKGDVGETRAPEYYQYIFNKHHITEKQFRSSMDYYLGQEEMMDQIYEDVINEISKRQAEGVNK